MTFTYTTKEGDMVDLVCAKYYGSTSGGQVEAVLAANPGLADYGPILPSGVQIVLPDITPQPATITRIWG